MAITSKAVASEPERRGTAVVKESGNPAKLTEHNGEDIASDKGTTLPDSRWGSRWLSK